MNRDCMEALQLAGQIIMENGGETYRAEETVRRMGEGFGLNHVESFAVPSGLFISYRNSDGSLETSVKRVYRTERNLSRVNEANRISRLCATGKMDSDQALQALRNAETLRGPVSPAGSIAAALICAAGFALLFRGGWKEMLCAGAVAALVQATGLLIQMERLSWIAATIIGGLLTALLPHLMTRLIPGLLAEATVAGAMMPLVPGLAMTNAVQDAMRGDMVSGISHGARALLTACLIAGGALLAAAVYRIVTGGGIG